MDNHTAESGLVLTDLCLPGSSSLFPFLSGEIQSTVTYDLALDPGRIHARAIFDETKNRTRRKSQVFGLAQKCETLKLLLPVSRQMAELLAEDGVAERS